MAVSAAVHLCVMHNNIPVVQDNLGGFSSLVPRRPHVILHHCLTTYDPRTILPADDDLARERAIAFSALMGNDFFVVVALPGALSVTSCHSSPSLRMAGCSKHT